jgi:hypothetical protein
MDLTLVLILLAAAISLAFHFGHKAVGRSLHLECHW